MLLYCETFVYIMLFSEGLFWGLMVIVGWFLTSFNIN